MCTFFSFKRISEMFFRITVWHSSCDHHIIIAEQNFVKSINDSLELELKHAWIYFPRKKSA